MPSLEEQIQDLKINPCPKCKSKDVGVGHLFQSYYVQCQKCWHKVNDDCKKFTINKAVEIWNEGE